MARYQKGHREQTRARIVASASHMLRAAGIDGVAIPALMQEVGLTHGGFYAHFPSKDALVAEACAAGLTEVATALVAIGTAAPHGAGLHAMLDWYLRAEHRDDPASGCVLPTLAGEIAREPPEVRHPFTTALVTLCDQFAPFVHDDHMHHREDSALIVLSGMVGAMLLARAVDNPTLSDRILAASRDFYARAFSTPEPDSRSTDSAPIDPSSGGL
jgi:TetR/AcrR family transcriptional repressor of nem operon